MEPPANPQLRLIFFQMNAKPLAKDSLVYIRIPSKQLRNGNDMKVGPFRNSATDNDDETHFHSIEIVFCACVQHRDKTSECPHMYPSA